MGQLKPFTQLGQPDKASFECYKLFVCVVFVLFYKVIKLKIKIRGVRTMNRGVRNSFLSCNWPSMALNTTVKTVSLPSERAVKMYL